MIQINPVKYFFSIIILFIASWQLYAQTWSEQIKDPANFYDIQSAFSDNYKLVKSKKNEVEDVEWNQFKRWEYFMEPRVYPSGKLPDPKIVQESYIKYNSFLFPRTPILRKANWKSLESENGFPVNGYAGRVNCIAFHPTDSNTIYIGTPAAGMWKSLDDGKSWKSLTDQLALMGVSEIAIDPVDPNVIYIATGDKDAANFFGNPYSMGILKSIDGGLNWDTTGIQFRVANQMSIQRLLIHPNNHQIILAAIRSDVANYKGIWRSTDAGKTWNNVSGGAKYDLVIHPTNPNIMYATGYKNIQRSTDGGLTWSIMNSTGLPPASDITWGKLAVTPAQPNLIYATFLSQSSGQTYGLYKSSDAGINWNVVNNDEYGTQGGYDYTIAASPIDSNLVLLGGQYLYISKDGGVSFSVTSSGHLDHHFLGYHSITKKLYNGNDGGIYKISANGKSWVNLNKGLQIFQYYRLGCSAKDPDFILTGAQDNGTNLHHLPSWKLISGGDGMECLIDYSDDQIYYTSSQNGTFSRFGNIAGTFTIPTDQSNCAWVTPMIIHPNNPGTLFFGAKDIYKTNDYGNTWINYSKNLTLNDNVGGGFLWHLAIAPSNPDSVLYATSYVVVYKTSDGGKSWKNVTSNLPTKAGCLNCAALNSITVHPDHPEVGWVTFSGYTDSTHVYMTQDGGEHWINISGTLPSVPINTLVFDNMGTGTLFIGTDMGVFYRDLSTNDWMPFMNGIPNVPVEELEIQQSSRKLRAATFGRGLWETEIDEPIVNVKMPLNNNGSDITIYPNPSTGIFNIDFLETDQSNEIMIFNIFGKLIKEELLEKNIIDLRLLPNGIYIYKIRGKQGNYYSGKVIKG